MATTVETLLHLLAICITFPPKSVVCQAGANEAVALHDSMGSQRNESSEIILRNCCFHSITDSENDVTNNCFPNVSFTWNTLSMYRISRENLTLNRDPSKIINSNLHKQLKCPDILQYTVPAWKSQLQPTGGFHVFFDRDGTFQYDVNIYSYDEFCVVHRDTHREIQVFACSHTNKCRFDIDNPSKKTKKMKSCLVRCCNYGEAWDISNPKPRCSNSGRHKWKPQAFADIDSNTTSTEVDSMTVLVTHPREIVNRGCHTYSFQSPRAVQYDQNEERFGNKLFKVLENGAVYIRIRKREWILLKAEQYCIDGFQIGEGNYSGDNADSILFECTTFETKETLESKQSQRRYSMAFGILLVICLFFLLVTAIVYVLLWSKHNIHGYTVFGYICSLLFAYLFLGISHFTTSSMIREDKGIMTSCGIIGILCHFTFLSVFSWSTVLNYDLWHTFRNLRPTCSKPVGLKRFVFYCIFAITLPLLIVTTGIYLDVWDDDHSDNITPGYGKTVCYVEPRIGRFYLVIIPIAIILGINLLLFCNTAYSVYQVKKSTQFATVNSTKNETGNQTLSLFIKLGLINGTIWLVEIISWWIQSDYEEIGIISFILDVITILQGVAIFFLFVMKDDILENLRRSYPSLKGLVNIVFRLKNCEGRGNTSGTVIVGSTTATSYNSRTQEGTSVTKL